MRTQCDYECVCVCGAACVFAQTQWIVVPGRKPELLRILWWLTITNSWKQPVTESGQWLGFYGSKGSLFEEVGLWMAEKRNQAGGAGCLCQAGTTKCLITLFFSVCQVAYITFHSKFYQVQTSSIKSGSVYLSPTNMSLAAVYWRQILVY